MALRFFKGFGEIVANDAELVGSSASVNSTYIVPPTGRRGAYVEGSWGSLRVTASPAATLASAGASALHVGFYSASVPSLAVMDAATSQGVGDMLSFNTFNGSQTVGGKVISKGWHWVELRIVRVASPLAYSYEVRVNGEQVNTGSVTTANGNIMWASSQLATALPSNSASFAYVSDLVVWDDVNSGDGFTSWMGPMQVDVMPAAGNGSKSEWLGSDGNSVDNYNLVKQVPLTTTTYVESSTDGQRDLYTPPALGAGLSPLGVRTRLFANKDGGALRGIKPVLIQNNGVDPAEEVVYPEKTLGLIPVQVTTKAESLSLLTGLPWTSSEIAELQFGVESSTPAP